MSVNDEATRAIHSLFSRGYRTVISPPKGTSMECLFFSGPVEMTCVPHVTVTRALGAAVPSMKSGVLCCETITPVVVRAEPKAWSVIHMLAVVDTVKSVTADAMIKNARPTRLARLRARATKVGPVRLCLALVERLDRERADRLRVRVSMPPKRNRRGVVRRRIRAHHCLFCAATSMRLVENSKARAAGNTAIRRGARA
jgi:hypothetical protein